MKRTEQTLLEQMHITEIDITRRMELLDLDLPSLDLLSKHLPVIEEYIDTIVGDFYQKQTEIPEIALLIGDADTLTRLSNAQKKYVLDLFSGHYDSEYVNNRLRIGMVHKRIGVEPKLYLSAVRNLKKSIFTTLEDSIEDTRVLKKTLDTLDKLIYFDTTLVFDTYIDCLVGEIEAAKNRAEQYAASLEEKVAERTHQLEIQARMDPLTEIYNQRAMQDYLRRELAIAKRRKTKLSLVYFDVDKFKAINDSQGHVEGDEVLKAIGQSLKSSIRETDIPCRYGGDEFCIILPECDSNEAKNICDKTIIAFSKVYPDYTLSIGIAETGTEDYDDGNKLIKRADEQMYLAKKEEGFKICA